MFKIIFYSDSRGREPIKEYINSLSDSDSKDCRIRLNKILNYIDVLEIYGLRTGEPYIKHISENLWELRPLKDRFFFFCWCGDKFIILHHFQKKTQKTPKREIEQAIRNMKDFIERNDKDER